MVNLTSTEFKREYRLIHRQGTRAHSHYPCRPRSLPRNYNPRRFDRQTGETPLPGRFSRRWRSHYRPGPCTPPHAQLWSPASHVKQIFFSLRLWKVLPHPYCYIGLLCIGLTVTRFGASIYLTTIAVAAKSALEYRQRNTVLPAVLLAGGAMIDLIIAASMMYYLMHKREKSMLR